MTATSGFQVLGDRVLLGIGELVVAVGTHDLTELLLATFAAAPTGSEQEGVLRLDDPRTAARHCAPPHRLVQA